MKLLFISPVLFWCLLDYGASDDDRDEVSVKEGDSVTLQTGVETNQQDRIRWYFNDTRFAQITKNLSKICTDVQCNEGTERFRGRLKLYHQTGSLTIMNITITDSGVYKVQMGNIKKFNVTVTAVPDSGLSTTSISARDVGAVLLVAAAGLLLLQEI